MADYCYCMVGMRKDPKVGGDDEGTCKVNKNTPTLTKSTSVTWFGGGLVRRVGDGSNTSLWFDNWLRPSNLHSMYRRLFNLNVLPYGNVCNFGSWVGKSWEWNISWRHLLFIWEQELCNYFLNDIKQAPQAKLDKLKRVRSYAQLQNTKYQSSDPRLSERFSPERERIT
ncbi:hypothetical protein Lal_00017270 [Lupinus albus]|nr:hypothetical protein Lal_00017270 [Lupinus albus]